MIYRVKDKSLKASITIQFRYFILTFFFLAIILSIGILFSSLIGKEVVLERSHYLIAIFLVAIVLYRLGSFALEHYKNSDSDFVELTSSTISSNYLGNSDTIDLKIIDSATVYNLLGNRLLVLTYEGKKHEMHVSGYDKNLIFDLSVRINHKVVEASLFQSLKYLIASD